MTRWDRWIKKITEYRDAKTAEEIAESMTDIKTVMALLLENYDDSKAAAMFNQALKGKMPDFAVPDVPVEEPPPTEYTPDRKLISPPQIDWAEVRVKGDNAISWKRGVTNAAAIASLVIEAVSLGQIEMVLPVINTIIGNTGLLGLGGDLQKIQNTEVYQELWTQYWKSYARTTLPGERDLLTMHQKGLITYPQMSKNMSYLGFHDAWVKLMMANTLKFPSTGVLENLVRRKVITLEEYKERAEKLGMDPKSVEDMSKIIEPMHSTSALIEFVVKEVITPENFYEYMTRQGWSPEEAKKYWESHWRLVSLDDLREMRNRAYITDETYKAELIKHDYRPEWADQLIKLSYRRPTLAQLRQIVEYTEFTDEEIEKVISDLGFEESWIPLMRKYLKSRRMSLERTRLLTELENQYIKGWTTKEKFKDKMVTLGFSLDVIEMRLEKATLRNDRERKDDLKDVYVKSYRNDYITIDELTASLTELGLREDVVSSIVALETVRKKPKTLLEEES